MALSKFQILPEEARYTVTDGEETVRSKLDGGKGRYRADILNSTSKVTVSWVFRPSQFSYFRSFYKGASAARGATPFLIDLILDEGTSPVEHTAYFVPNKVKLRKVRGESYEVTAELEVIPVTYESGYHDAIVWIYETYGEDQTTLTTLLDQLEQLVNTDIPGEPVFIP